MVNLNKKPGFLLIISLVFGLISVADASNPTEESTLVEIGGPNVSEKKSSDADEKSIPSPLPEKPEKSLLRNDKVIIKKKSTTTLHSKSTEFQPSVFARDPEGNIPIYAKRNAESEREYQDPSVETNSSTLFQLIDLKRGTTLHAVIESDIVAYPDSQAPVRAIVTAPEKYKRATILGSANLDTATKRVNIEFHTLIRAADTTSYSIKGITSDRSGKLGLGGIHKTEFWNWLWAEVLVRSSGGIVEASEEQDRSLFGSAASVNPTNAAKKGVSTGLNTMAERFGEKRSKAVEMTEVSGPTAITISIIQ